MHATIGIGGLILVVTTATNGGQTPGVTVTLTQHERLAAVCPGIDSSLRELRLRVWLSWVQKRRPRSLEGYTERWLGDSPSDEETRRWVPLPDASFAEQKRIWDQWAEPVVITMVVCSTPETPVAQGRPGVCDFAITKSARGKIVDLAAQDAIVTARSPLLPTCAGDYKVDVRFEPWADPVLVIDAAIAALSDDSPEIRESAAVALGAMGPEARPAIVALQRATKDHVKAVREAAEGALLDIRGGR